MKEKENEFDRFVVKQIVLNSTMEINTLTGIIIEAAIKVHTTIGPGCYEKVYEECMVYELYRKNVEVHRQLTLPISYEELRIENAYKLDLLVDERVIVEIKCVYDMHPVHFKQLNTYLKLLNLKHGILLNFKTNLMKEGIHRVFNNKGIE